MAEKMPLRHVAFADQVDTAVRQSLTGMIEDVERLEAAGRPVGAFPTTPAVKAMIRRMLDELTVACEEGSSGLCPHLDLRRPRECFWLAWLPQRIMCVDCADFAAPLASSERCDSCGRQGRVTWAMKPAKSVVVTYARPTTFGGLWWCWSSCSECLTGDVETS